MDTQAEKMRIIKRRRKELESIYGEERGNRCLESSFEECFWDGYDKGYVAGCAATLARAYIKGL